MQWKIWIQSTRWTQKPPVALVRASFEQMGFTIHPQKFDYYNPTRANRFIAEHSKAGAITLWSLAWSNHWPNTNILIEDYETT